MAFCQNCGASLTDNAEFCTSCGTKSGAAQPVNNIPNTKKMHCPQCKSHSIAPINESSVTAGLTTHHGGMSATSFSNQQRAFWMCADCGAKFRSIPSLEEEIKKTKNQPVISTVISIIAFIISIFLLVNIMSNPFALFFSGSVFVGTTFVTIVSFIFIFVSRSKLKKMRAELEYLKINCFN